MNDSTFTYWDSAGVKHTVPACPTKFPAGVGLVCLGRLGECDSEGNRLQTPETQELDPARGKVLPRTAPPHHTECIESKSRTCPGQSPSNISVEAMTDDDQSCLSEA